MSFGTLASDGADPLPQEGVFVAEPCAVTAAEEKSAELLRNT